MKTLIIFAFLVTWFSIAVTVSFFVSSTYVSAVATFFLLIAFLALAAPLLLRSGTFNYILSNIHMRPTPIIRDDLSKTAFYIRLATHRRSYGFREVALVLREAFLTESFGAGAYPLDWIGTQHGDGPLAELLKSKNSYELMDVIRIPEMSAVVVMKKEEYLSKLDKALSLIEEKSSD